ncbi:MAG TPA: hypothetical protein VFG20_07240 [Planctomycetaceae bacterium]|nr:hypothetical protein [Planctomycetaceae bacterium]
MNDESSPPRPAPPSVSPPNAEPPEELPACPVCGGHLIEIRQKWICERCHTICQTCCEGGRG